MSTLTLPLAARQPDPISRKDPSIDHGFVGVQGLLMLALWKLHKGPCLIPQTFPKVHTGTQLKCYYQPVILFLDPVASLGSLATAENLGSSIRQTVYAPHPGYAGLDEHLGTTTSCQS